MMTLNILLSAAVQFLIGTAVPFLCWLMSGRRSGNSFWRWIGWHRPRIQDRRRFALYFALGMIALIGPGLMLSVFVLKDSEMANAQFAGLGLSGLLPMLIYSFGQTALSEELLFRGFLGKQVSARFGFARGNAFQAALFGLLHVVMFASSAGWLALSAVFMLTGFAGWLLGYLNERLGGGSIMPSWLLHGTVNLLSCLYVWFGG